jgi:hypothetical protein
MKELRMDLWVAHAQGIPIVITTNGGLRKDGACVMGRGIAAQAKHRYPSFPYEVGRLIRLYGNSVYYITDEVLEVTAPLITFPVKHHWSEVADPALISTSALGLLRLVNNLAIPKVYMPRPGCGNGHLSWDVVKPLLIPYLDDRFTICEVA